MFGFEVPANVDLKPAMKAVRKINKKAAEVNADAAMLKLTLIAQPKLFHVGKGLGPFEGSYLLVLEHERFEELPQTIEAIGDPKMALRVERSPAAEAGGEQVRIALQMAGMAARIYAHDIVLKSSTEVFVYSDDWAANDYKQGGKAWLALRQFTGADVVGSPQWDLGFTGARVVVSPNMRNYSSCEKKINDFIDAAKATAGKKALKKNNHPRKGAKLCPHS